MSLLRWSLSLLLLDLGFTTTALAAKKNPDTIDLPPQLISTKGPAAKWKNIEELKQFAAKGDPQACFELADRSQEGDGVPHNLTEAIRWFERAAQGGVADAWFRLGKIYHDGLDEAPDYGRALDYFTTAAKAGVAEAQHNIGAMLVSARGVRRDFVEGLAWLIVAKKSGAYSEAEEQVRIRLTKRPADIAAAEARAVELTKDMANATVRATRTSTAAAKPTPPAAPALEKPTLVKPTIEPAGPPKISVPVIQPTLPTEPPGKS